MSSHNGAVLVLGNGSSRKDLPSGWQKDYITFGVNFCGFQPTYYVCVDSSILLHHRKEIAEFVEGAEEAFINQQYEKHWEYLGDKIVPIGRYHTKRSGEGGWNGSVIVPTLRIACLMGFSPINVAGVDLEPEWKHYRDDYMRPRDSDTAGRGDNIRAGLRNIKYQVEAGGGEIYNVCPSSPMDVFERRELAI